jgi:hypothetical protein
VADQLREAIERAEEERILISLAACEFIDTGLTGNGLVVETREQALSAAGGAEVK